MLREYVSNRKKGPIFINENEEMLSLEWFNQEISRYAKLLGIQKIKKYYVDGSFMENSAHLNQEVLDLEIQIHPCSHIELHFQREFHKVAVEDLYSHDRGAKLIVVFQTYVEEIFLKPL